MLLLNGTGIGSVAIGRALVMDEQRVEVASRSLETHEIEREVERFEAAVERAREGLGALRRQLPESAPPELSAFLDAHALMLEDPLLIEETTGTIRAQRINPEAALNQQAERLRRVFDGMDDEYLRSKKHDIDQVVDRVQRELAASGNPLLSFGDDLKDRIIVVNDLTPADTVHFKHKNMTGFITNLGGPISHTAILARGLKLPAVVGLHGACRLIRDNELVVIDGVSGTVLVGPDERMLGEYERRIERARIYNAGLESLKEVEARSSDGAGVLLMANVELPEDIAAALEVNAAGVGLYRTEFMFMNREAPGEQEQYEEYRSVVERIDGPVTIRTLDLGADKQVDGGRADARTANPALGLRAVRLCLGNPGIFVPQLRAILRASVHGDVRIMIPMLSSLHELDQVLELVREVKNALSRECAPFDPETPLGGMVEVPATAVAADLFARKLDFLSLGTNDLIQYTLAIDRVDDEVNYLYDPLHPSVLRLIRHTIEAGENNKIPVSMCGEMAGDPGYTQLLLGLGLREFSMDPATLLEVKKEVLDAEVASLASQAQAALYDADVTGLRSLVRRNAIH